MLLDGTQHKQEGKKMTINSCKVIIKNPKQTTTTNGVAYTSDVELYISLLDCPR
jgi:hypothetical protein